MLRECPSPRQHVAHALLSAPSAPQPLPCLQVEDGFVVVKINSIEAYHSCRELLVLCGEDLSLNVRACKCLVTSVPIFVPHVSCFLLFHYLYLHLYQQTWESCFHSESKFGARVLDTNRYTSRQNASRKRSKGVLEGYVLKLQGQDCKMAPGGADEAHGERENNHDRE